MGDVKEEEKRETQQKRYGIGEGDERQKRWRMWRKIERGEKTRRT